jgi:hypothetical protein
MKSFPFPILGLAVAALSLAMTLPVCAQGMDAPQAVVFDNGRDARNIPFELAGNHIYVRVRVNGGAPLWFLFDSGAAENAQLIDPKSATPQTGPIANARIALAGVKLNAQTLEPRPLTFASSDGHPLDGVLTYGFIRHFVVAIDYAARTLSLYDPKRFHYAGPGERVPLTPLEADSGANIYLMELAVTSPDGKTVSGHFIVDTGVRLALTVNTPFVLAHDMLASQTHTVTAIVGSGLSIKDTTLVLGRMPSLAAGNLVLRNVIAAFSQYKTGVLALSEFDGIVGGEFLRRFRVILDYSRNEMILEKNAQFGQAFEYDMSGAFLLAEGERFDAFRVHAVIAGSPAAEAGLVEGDRIVAIDGRAASGFSLQAIQALFRQDGTRHALQIERAGKKILLTLKLRRLV